MKVTGIIAEYNPFHKGHKYHLDKAKELTNPDITIAVITGNYNQRGDLSIINKFEKTKAALDNGVDLVVELPYIYTTQNAFVYGKTAVDILKALKVNYLVFGSETNNLKELKKFAELNIDVTHLKTLLRDGNSFPKAYGLLAGSLYPNDILAVSYLKALKGSKIKPISIQRTNSYHSEEIVEISSASAIRKAIKENNKDYKKTVLCKIHDPVFMEDLYSHFRQIMFVSNPSDLKDIFLVSEGIENLLIKNAYEFDSYEDFINNSVSKRYTKSRIKRIMLQIVNNVTKDDVKKLPKLNYIRVLGFNTKGQEYLKSLKKTELNIITQFKKIPLKYKEIEWKSSAIYASLTKNEKKYLKEELKGPIIKKD